MISTNTRKIVIVGGYPFPRKEWYKVDNKEVDWEDFSGIRFNNSLFRIPENQNGRFPPQFPNGDWARVIESFEYIVRSDSDKYSGVSRGFKTDILFIKDIMRLKDISVKDFDYNQNWIERPNHFLKEMNSGDISTRLGFDDLSENIGYRRGQIAENYNSVRYLNHYLHSGYGTLKEIWYPVSSIYSEILENKKNSDKYIKKTVIRFNEHIAFWQEYLNINIKYLTFDEYINLKELTDKYEMNKKDILDLLVGTKWFNQMGQKNMLDASTIIEQMCGIKKTLSEDKGDKRISRGVESLYLLLIDSRFNRHKKYFVGFLPIFNYVYPSNLLKEYMLLTDWLDSRKLHYLPEDVESIRNYNMDSVDKSKFNLYEGQ